MSEVRLPAPVKAIHDPGLKLWHERGDGDPPPAPGSFRWGGDPPEGIWIVCPCGCGDERMLPVRVAGEEVLHPSWAWDGNREKPTLSPSIFAHKSDGPHWHGWLQAGFFNQA